jgi:hypothetical protein
MATRASERASGPVNEVSRLAAARSQGDWAEAVNVQVRRIPRRVEGPAVNGGLRGLSVACMTFLSFASFARECARR